MASLISPGVPSCLALDAWMWAHFTILDIGLSFQAENRNYLQRKAKQKNKNYIHLS